MDRRKIAAVFSGSLLLGFIVFRPETIEFFTQIFQEQWVDEIIFRITIAVPLTALLFLLAELFLSPHYDRIISLVNSDE